ncbi:MAG: transposase domain-containing protein [Phycisphaeraceae bacterium]|nr:transposase domain-containing protein [Phycisphaeraceae bacterium]
MFSLISSAKRNHIEPTAYLNDLFTRLPETSTDNSPSSSPITGNPRIEPISRCGWYGFRPGR